MPIRELLFDHADRDLTQLEEYRAVGGYEPLRRALGMERDAIIEQVLESGLKGRGGAGFPAGRKAGFIPKPGQRRAPAYLTVNADESEPGTFKDREIMLRIPHAVIEGSLIAAYAIDADQAFIYLRGEYLTEFDVMRAALD